MSKPKVLAWSDTPVNATGFAQVANAIYDSLKDDFELEIVGIGHMDSWYDQTKYPYKIHSTSRDDKLGIQTMNYMILNGEFDILFTLNNPEVLRAIVPAVRKRRYELNKPFKWVIYSPIDVDFYFRTYFDAFNEADKVYLYTDFAKEVMLKHEPHLESKIGIIPHGVGEHMKALSLEERREIRASLLNIVDDTPLMLVVGRNDWRKDHPRAMWIFDQVRDQMDCKIYFHCKPQDIGGNLLAAASTLKHKKDIKFAAMNFDVGKGVGINALNELFNASDVLLTTSMGEGWGLPITEAFKVGLPIVAPRHSAIQDLVGKDSERGYLFDAGSTSSEWVVPSGSSWAKYPLANVEAGAKAVIKALTNKQETAEKTLAANRWDNLKSWEEVGGMWLNAFNEVL